MCLTTNLKFLCHFLLITPMAIPPLFFGFRTLWLLSEYKHWKGIPDYLSEWKFFHFLSSKLKELAEQALPVPLLGSPPWRPATSPLKWRQPNPNSWLLVQKAFYWSVNSKPSCLLYQIIHWFISSISLLLSSLLFGKGKISEKITCWVSSSVISHSLR